MAGASRLHHLLRVGFALTLAVVFTSVSQGTLNASAFPSACTNQTGTVYEVGDGQPYTSIGAVPFDTLQPGDLVRIHHRATPYREKIAISTSGTQAAPICMVGVAGTNGELPVIDGENATTSDSMFYDYDGMQERALLIVMGQEWGEQPAYIHIEGLHFKNAYEDYTFTTANGQVRNYTSNAAALMVQRGADITLTGLAISDSGNGFFAASSGDAEQTVRNLTLQYSYIYGNGTDSDQHHNIYTESNGMIIQFNRFGPTRSISGGNNIKDRSAGTIIRYNWIETGAHLIDLVEAEDGYDLLSQNPNYDKAWVYGNIMISPENSLTGRNMIHFGGDLGGEEEGNSTVCGFGGGQDPTECYRKGPLYFYNNTVITEVNQEGDGSYCCSKTYFRLQTDEQSIEVFNNIFHVVSLGNETWVSYMNRRGQANFGVNLLKPATNMAEFYNQEGPNSEVNGLGNLIVLGAGEEIGFVNEAAGDYHLLVESLAVNSGAPITGADLLPIPFEYLVHQGSIARIDDGSIDMGAYEQGDNPPQVTNTPQATGTAQPTGTAQATGTAGAPTATPTPPATVDPLLNLLSNGDFETDSDLDGQPDSWVAKEFAGDKQKCNKDTNDDGVVDKIFALQGSCAYRFKSGSLENSKLEQIIPNSAITTGDTISVSGFVYPKGEVDVAVKIRVKYVDTTLEKGKITLKVTTPTTAYVPLSGTLTLPIVGEVASFKVKLQNRGASGKVLFDALAVVKTASRSSGLSGQ
ncbi:MAG: hypothetical protein H7Y11_08130 [Armatimonadetes bacterium]|nr:hypothetical protein [Anaerolineae bacterium]